MRWPNSTASRRLFRRIDAGQKTETPDRKDRAFLSRRFFAAASIEPVAPSTLLRQSGQSLRQGSLRQTGYFFFAVFFLAAFFLGAAFFLAAFFLATVCPPNRKVRRLPCRLPGWDGSSTGWSPRERAIRSNMSLVKHASKRYDKPSFDRLHSLRSFESRYRFVGSLLVRRLIN